MFARVDCVPHRTSHTTGKGVLQTRILTQKVAETILKDAPCLDPGRAILRLGLATSRDPHSSQGGGDG